MRLSKRIYAICEHVNTGETIADIGTDHGYVPMLLVRNKISPKAIMCDISADSLSKAQETFRELNLPCSEDSFRVGDGLKPLEKGEVDDVIIAGLGGHTISDILAFDLDKSRSYSKIIMQPRKHSGNLRYFLYVNGFDIIQESLVPEGKFICEIITAVPTDTTEREPLWDEDDIRWKYPQAFEFLDRECVTKRLSWKINSIDEELQNLQRSSKDEQSINAMTEKLQQDRKYLAQLLERNSRNEKA